MLCVSPDGLVLLRGKLALLEGVVRESSVGDIDGESSSVYRKLRSQLDKLSKVAIPLEESRSLNPRLACGHVSPDEGIGRYSLSL